MRERLLAGVVGGALLGYLESTPRSHPLPPTNEEKPSRRVLADALEISKRFLGPSLRDVTFDYYAKWDRQEDLSPFVSYGTGDPNPMEIMLLNFYVCSTNYTHLLESRITVEVLGFRDTETELEPILESMLRNKASEGDLIHVANTVFNLPPNMRWDYSDGYTDGRGTHQGMLGEGVTTDGKPIVGLILFGGPAFLRVFHAPQPGS